jgi:hypothetical protein
VVFGVDGSVLGSAVNIDLALQAILPNQPGFRGPLPSSYTIDRSIVRYKNASGATEISETTIGIAGFDTALAPPPQVSLLVQKISGLAGRKNRGRMYFPAPNEAVIDAGGNWIGGSLATWQADMNQFYADLVASSIPMVILHDDPADTPTPVSSLNVSPLVATQRRRLR